MSIRIVNLRDYVEVEGEVLVRVDRKSALGNPYRMRDLTECERDRVCDAYVKYFNRKVKEKGDFRNEVIRIYRMVRDGKDVALGCWCFPKRCHAEYIKKFIEKYLEESKGSSSRILHHPNGVYDSNDRLIAFENKTASEWSAYFKKSIDNWNQFYPTLISAGTMEPRWRDALVKSCIANIGEPIY